MDMIERACEFETRDVSWDWVFGTLYWNGIESIPTDTNGAVYPNLQGSGIVPATANPTKFLKAAAGVAPPIPPLTIGAFA
jgi:hypothetical protein